MATNPMQTPDPTAAGAAQMMPGGDASDTAGVPVAQQQITLQKTGEGWVLAVDGQPVRGGQPLPVEDVAEAVEQALGVPDVDNTGADGDEAQTMWDQEAQKSAQARQMQSGY